MNVTLTSDPLARNAYRVTNADTGEPLGRVIRGTRSTDSRIAGTRLRRAGKGAPEWSAEVPREDWQDSHSGIGAARAQLQSDFCGGYRLEWNGQKWDRRKDAVEALIAWAGGDRA